MKSLKELCLNSGNEESFNPERLHRLEEMLIEDHRSDLPWYLRIIIGIGAWLAACFFLGFAITLIGWQDEHQTTIGIIGVVLLIIAVVVGRKKVGLFFDQCALAVSLAGQAMIYYGFVNEQYHPLATVVIFSLVLAAVLYIAYPSFLSRLMTCFFALQITTLWIYAGNGEPFSGPQRMASHLSELVLGYWAFHLATICWCFLNPRRSTLFAPLGYALIASLTTWQVENLSNIWSITSMSNSYDAAMFALALFWAKTVLIALTIFGVSIWAAGGLSVLREKPLLFIGLALTLAVLVWLGPGGVLLALLFMLLGFSLQSRVIFILGLILFPIFLSNYYYNLSLDLLVKSIVLIGSGLAMLLLRTGLKRWVFADLKEAI